MRTYTHWLKKHINEAANAITNLIVVTDLTYHDFRCLDVYASWHNLKYDEIIELDELQDLVTKTVRDGAELIKIAQSVNNGPKVAKHPNPEFVEEIVLNYLSWLCKRLTSYRQVSLPEVKMKLSSLGL